MPQNNQVLNVFWSDLGRIERVTRPGNHPLAEGLRARGWEQFEKLGFPGHHLEDWKYTNTGAIIGRSYDVVETAGNYSDDDVKKFISDNARTILFVNGVYQDTEDSKKINSQGVSVRPLRHILTQAPETLGRLIGVIEKIHPVLRDGFIALNQAMLREGVWIDVSENAVSAAPLYILYITTPEANGRMMCPRNIITLGQGAQANVVESYVSMEGGVYLTNTTTDIVVGANAKLSYTVVESESSESFHVKNTNIHQSRDSHAATYVFSLGANLARNNLTVRYEDEGCYTDLYGLYVPTGTGHVDHHTLVDHAFPNSVSNQLYKGILSDRSRGVFNGKILVRPGAQKTNAYQLNKNIMLSRQAHVDTKPELEILADDVRCTHGATIGQLNEDEIFYVTSRGVSRENAVSMLSRAFAEDVISRIENEAVQKTVRDVLSRKFTWM